MKEAEFGSQFFSDLSRVAARLPEVIRQSPETLLETYQNVFPQKAESLIEAARQELFLNEVFYWNVDRLDEHVSNARQRIERLEQVKDKRARVISFAGGCKLSDGDGWPPVFAFIAATEYSADAVNIDIGASFEAERYKLGMRPINHSRFYGHIQSDLIDLLVLANAPYANLAHLGIEPGTWDIVECSTFFHEFNPSPTLIHSIDKRLEEIIAATGGRIKHTFAAIDLMAARFSELADMLIAPNGILISEWYS